MNIALLFAARRLPEHSDDSDIRIFVRIMQDGSRFCIGADTAVLYPVGVFMADCAAKQCFSSFDISDRS